MVGGFKSSDPIVKFSLKQLKQGNTIEREVAIATAICIFKQCPSLEIDSICEGMGHLDIESEVLDQCADIMAAMAGSSPTPSPKTKSSDDEPVDLPTGNVDPSYTPDDQTRSISDMYLLHYSFKTRTVNTPFSSSDEHIARMALLCVGQNNCRRLRRLENWLLWSSSYWRKGDEGDVRTLLSKLGDAIDVDLKSVNRMGKEAALDVIGNRYNCRDAQRKDDLLEFEKKTMRSVISRLHSFQGMQTIAKRMGDYLMVDPDEDLDNNEGELVFSNITWNLNTGKSYAPRRESLATRSIRMNWSEPTRAAKERWQAYLDGLGFSQETNTFLKRSFGYTSLGLGTVKRFWWFRGVGDTSKSTIIHLIAKSLDKYTESTNTATWLYKAGGQSGHTDNIASLQGCRMVYADDFPQVCRFDDSLLKQVTSGGVPMHASAKGEKGFTFKIRFGLFCSSNFDPLLSEEDDAAMNRLTTLTFKSIVKNKNTKFVDEYLQDHDNRLAILSWVMEGAMEYLKHGFGEEPEEVKASRLEFRADQVSLSDQINQLVVKGPTSMKGGLSLSLLLKELTKFQHDTRQKTHFSSRAVSKAVKKLFNVESKSSNSQTLFPGLRLRQEEKNDVDDRLDWKPTTEADYE